MTFAIFFTATSSTHRMEKYRLWSNQSGPGYSKHLYNTVAANVTDLSVCSLYCTMDNRTPCHFFTRLLSQQKCFLGNYDTVNSTVSILQNNLYFHYGMYVHIPFLTQRPLTRLGRPTGI